MSFVIESKNNTLLLLPPVEKPNDIRIPIGSEFWDRLNLITKSSLLKSIETPKIPHKTKENDYFLVKSKVTKPMTKATTKKDSHKNCRKRKSDPTINCQKKENLFHLTGKTYRKQRVGPSCDSCSKKKIKCDALIQVMEEEVDTKSTKTDKYGKVLDMDLVKKYITAEEMDQDYRLILHNQKLIKFRKCTFCKKNEIEPCYKRGYTKGDILMFNIWKDIHK